MKPFAHAALLWKPLDMEGSIDQDTGGFGDEEVKKPRQLPDDLPRSLNDRRSVPTFTAETEIYDAWQGMDPSLLP